MPPRSRAGCLICRARRVKCDEAQPTCGRCAKFNAECRFPEKKQFSDHAIATALANRHEYRRRARRERLAAAKAEAESRQSVTPSESGSIAASCTSPAETVDSSKRVPSRLSPSASPTDHVHVKDAEWFKFDDMIAIFRQTRMGTFYSRPVDPPTFLQMVLPDDVERRCFHHCITYSSSILVVVEGRMPWVSMVAPLCFPPSEPSASALALRSAFIAFGATHLFSLQLRRPGVVDRADFQAVAQRHRALSANQLRDASKNATDLESDTFLAAALGLLINDVFGAETRWPEIWRYAQRAIRRRGGPNKIISLHRTPSSLQQCLMGYAAMWDFVVSINTMTAPALLTGDMSWWKQLSGTQPTSPQFVSSPTPTGPPELEWDWLEKMTAWHPQLLAIAASIVGCAADCAEIERLTGPFDLEHLSALAEQGDTLTMHALAERALKLMDALEKWRYELPTSLSCPRVQVGSLAMWHASRIILLTQVYARGGQDRHVQSSARAIIELCFEAGDKPEFLQLPVMVACSVLEDEKERERVRAILRAMEYVAVFEVQSLRHVVEESWRRKEEGMDDAGCRWPHIRIETGRPVLIC